mmetsp:Transcript_81068/g.173332  ORF Transcript_81068/g.173332 Transcript_81068/m.173332 type:complete len:322 (+) Transcript_81068:41-1006(+)
MGCIGCSCLYTRLRRSWSVVLFGLLRIVIDVVRQVLLKRLKLLQLNVAIIASVEHGEDNASGPEVTEVCNGQHPVVHIELPFVLGVEDIPSVSHVPIEGALKKLDKLSNGEIELVPKLPQDIPLKLGDGALAPRVQVPKHFLDAFLLVRSVELMAVHLLETLLELLHSNLFISANAIDHNEGLVDADIFAHQELNELEHVLRDFCQARPPLHFRLLDIHVEVAVSLSNGLAKFESPELRRADICRLESAAPWHTFIRLPTLGHAERQLVLGPVFARVHWVENVIWPLLLSQLHKKSRTNALVVEEVVQSEAPVLWLDEWEE